VEGWPAAIDRHDLVRYFAVAGEDLAFVRGQRGAANQLGIGVQLGALRWLGFIPEDLAGVPEEALSTLGAALDVAPRAIFDYAVRAPVRADDRKRLDPARRQQHPPHEIARPSLVDVMSVQDTGNITAAPDAKTGLSWTSWTPSIRGDLIDIMTTYLENITFSLV
jgi:hypothetical protein